MKNVEYRYTSGKAMPAIGFDEPMERRLTSILAADMAGYSRWMSCDEEGVIRCLRWVRAKVIDPTLNENGGRIVRIMGDGLLVEFASPVSAVKTAISIQQTLASLEVGDLNKHLLRFRIGLNLGNVVVDGDDILGDCVNIAARLESIAPIGGICMTRAVHDQVKSQINVPMTALGARSLKNMPDPVEVWQIDLDSMLVHTEFEQGVVASVCG